MFSVPSIIDAAASGCIVKVEGAVRDVEGVIIEDAATVDCAVAAEVAVRDGQRAIIIDAATVDLRCCRRRCCP